MDFWFRLSFRTRLGIIASVLLMCAVVVLLSWYHDPIRFSYRQSWVIRFAPLLFLIWLAWTDLKSIPWWNWFLMMMVLLICAIRPAVWLVGIPIIGYILFAGRNRIR